jgi:hypothetical protein
MGEHVIFESRTIRSEWCSSKPPAIVTALTAGMLLDVAAASVAQEELTTTDRLDQWRYVAAVEEAYAIGIQDVVAKRWSSRMVSTRAPRREILSVDVGEAETGSVLDQLLRGLASRGLVSVQLAISDADTGLQAAIAKELSCSSQRCTVRFLPELPRARAQGPGRPAGGVDPAGLQRRLRRRRHRRDERRDERRTPTPLPGT